MVEEKQNRIAHKTSTYSRNFPGMQRYFCELKKTKTERLQIAWTPEVMQGVDVAIEMGRNQQENMKQRYREETNLTHTEMGTGVLETQQYFVAESPGQHSGYFVPLTESGVCTSKATQVGPGKMAKNGLNP